MTLTSPGDDGPRRPSFDVAVIGGGLLGCAVARDAAGRGLSVFLCEQNDIGSGATASVGGAIHAGLHNLASGRWGILRRNARERDLLRRAAPFAVRPQAFVLPHHSRLWPERKLRPALAAYDRLARTDLPRSRKLRDDEDHAAFGPLQDHFASAFEIHDCIADPARLAMLHALDANARGALLVPRHRCVLAEREGARWSVALESAAADQRFQIRARVLVNATGVSVAETAAHIVHAATGNLDIGWLRTKAIYVRRRPGETAAYLLPGHDGRIIQAIPHGDDLLRISAEEEPVARFDGKTDPDRREIADLLDIVGQYFAEPPSLEDVVRTEGALTSVPRSGEDHDVIVDAPQALAPVVTVFGGPVTAHRLVAERAVDRVSDALKAGPGWTAGHPLPGTAGFPDGGIDALVKQLERTHPFIGGTLARRLAKRYGARATDVLAGAQDRADLGAWFGAYLTEREVAYLCEREWAQSAEDVLWRRTRAGLDLDDAGVRRLEAWFAARGPQAAGTRRPTQSAAA